MATAEEALQAEGCRAVLGVLAARQRDSTADALRLIEDYRATARDLGFCEGRVFIQLFGSSVAVMRRMVDVLAEERGVTPEEVTQEFAADAAAWLSETQGVGGY